MEPLISIVTVTYNSEETLGDTIESVLNQTYSSIEYIIVDGKSKDGTVELAENYRDAFDKKGYAFRLISEEDEGIYDAMNKGIRMANGEVIGLINSDDWYELDTIENVVKCYSETGFDLAWGEVRLINMLNRDIIKRAKIKKYITTRDWHHASTFVTKNIYNKYQYNTRGLYSDFDLWLKVRKAGYNIAVINKVLANTRITGVSHNKDIRSVTGRMREKYQIYRSNGYSRLYIIESVFHELSKVILA